MGFDDIGFFGLPVRAATPISSSSASITAKRRRKKANNENRSNKSAVKRPNNWPQDMKKKHESESSSSDSEEDNMALAQLALPRPKKQPSSSSSIASSAAVTPAPSLSKRNVTTQTKSDKKSNKKPRPTKQLGLHSFLTKGTTTKKSSLPSCELLNGSGSGAAITSMGGGDTATTSSATSNDVLSTSNKNRPHSFVTAATMLNNDREKNTQSTDGVINSNGTQQNTIQCHDTSYRNWQGVQDELKELSDDESNEEGDCNAAEIALSQSEANDDGIPKEDGHSEFTENYGDNQKCGAVIESKEERLSKMRKKHNPIEFGIHKCIFGHKHPNMDPGVKSKAVSELFEGTDYPKHRQQQSRLLHGKSGVNILSHLFQRSYLSTTSPRNFSNVQRHVHRGDHWNVCDTVELATNGGGILSGGEVNAMSFDRDGVLLATGDDRGCVRIYDFDDVYALDVKKRNERCRSLWEAGRQDSIVASERVVKQIHDTDTATTTVVDGSSNDLNNELNESSNAGNVAEDVEEAPAIKPAIARPVLSFQCMARHGGNVGPRISSVLWSPQNQDYLAVSFAINHIITSAYPIPICHVVTLYRNQQEVHIYDVASAQSPIPFLRLGDSRQSRSEGILKATFFPSSTKSSSANIHGVTNIITGGNYGTVRLWSISRPQSKQQGSPSSISNFNTKCLWSTLVFESKGEGVCDMIVLPSESCNDDRIKPAPPVKKPLVLFAGTASSLALLDTNKCTRKAFSTTVTPTVAASWDLYHLVVREMSKIDSGAKLPARRWMAAHQLSLLCHECTNDVSYFRISIVAKCGFVIIAELSVPSASSISTNQIQTNSIRLRLHIVHHTPRIQCFNSLNERLTTLGGMALQFSLPDVPIPSTIYRHTSQNDNMIWLGEAKARKYTMPSKDKYIVCEDHGTVSFQTAESTSSERTPSSKKLRDQGEGLILAHLDKLFDTTSAVGPQGGAPEQERFRNECIGARLPLSHGSPLSLAAHPNGEWMMVGYGMNGRGAATKLLELVCMRKNLP
ncbi:hypothetical protein ACHAXR_008756 [Thalassiosira sp. AJA248-18]